MTLALVAMLLTSTPATPPPSLVPSLSALSPRQGMLVESLGNRGGQIYAGVRLTVSGSILLLVGAAPLIGGTYALIRSGSQTGSDFTVSQVLGWTFFGIGALLAVVGLPLLIVGIVNLATVPPKVGSLGISREGNLAVFF
ncbi:MAG: hypothetical protein QM817_29955 [Archangium sp.]